MPVETSNRQPDSEQTSDKRTEYTTKECEELGLVSKFPAPEPVQCQFCGKTLYYTGIYLWGTIICWSPSPQRCDCAEAVEWWKAEDARRAKEKAEKEAEEARKRRLERQERLVKSSGMGKRFLQRTFDNFIAETDEQRRALAIAKRFADTFPERLEDGRGLYIEGTNGTGKTHLAAAIAIHLMQNLRRVIFRTYGDLLDEVKRTYDRDGNGATEYELSQEYRNCDLLIIDDLGKEQCTDWSVSFLYGVINDRYESMMPTIVTTNYDSDGLIKALTPTATGDSQKAKAIVSRLYETSVVLTMAWDDYRNRKAGK